MKAELTNGKVISVPVESWSSTNFKAGVVGEYLFTAKFAAAYGITKNVEITVVVNDKTTDGLTASYYSNAQDNDLSKDAVLVGKEVVKSDLIFSWGAEGPCADAGFDNFAVEYTGYINVETAGTYAFRVVSNDAQKLVVNGKTLTSINKSGSNTAEKEVKLEAGPNEFYLLYREEENSSGVTVYIKAPGSDEFVIVPASMLTTDLD